MGRERSGSGTSWSSGRSCARSPALGSRGLCAGNVGLCLRASSPQQRQSERGKPDPDIPLGSEGSAARAGCGPMVRSARGAQGPAPWVLFGFSSWKPEGWESLLHRPCLGHQEVPGAPFIDYSQAFNLQKRQEITQGCAAASLGEVHGAELGPQNPSSAGDDTQEWSVPVRRLELNMPFSPNNRDERFLCASGSGFTENCWEGSSVCGAGKDTG